MILSPASYTQPLPERLVLYWQTSRFLPLNTESDDQLPTPLLDALINGQVKQATALQKERRKTQIGASSQGGGLCTAVQGGESGRGR